MHIVKLSRAEWTHGPLPRLHNSILNVSPFVDLGDLVPSPFIIAGDLSKGVDDRHNRIGFISVFPELLYEDHDFNEGLSTIMDLSDGVVGVISGGHRDGINDSFIDKVIPSETLKFLRESNI